MASISVPPGKGGVIILGSAHLYLSSWQLSLDVDNELYKHFEQTADGNSLVWANVVTGHMTGEVTVTGKFDATNAAYLPTSKSVWPNQANTGWLGYTSTIGFNIGYTIIGVRAVQNAEQPAGATYEARLRITACTFDTHGP